MFVFSCVAALLGAQVILTDLPDRLRLLKKNVDANLGHVDLKGSALVQELTWGDHPHPHIMNPLPDFGNHLILLHIYRYLFVKNAKLYGMRKYSEIEQRN